VALLKQFIDSRIASGEIRPHDSEVTARCMFSVVFMAHFTRDVFESSRSDREIFIHEALHNMMQGIATR
jgi:hypothetical protein